MSTQSQVLANQANAQHSTGPRTEQGKASVSTNATTHGATSKQAIVKGESQTEYQSHLQQFTAEFHPVTLHEKFLVKEMADAAWRMRRLHIWEMMILDQCDAANANPFDDEEQFRKLDRAHRHIQSIERSYHRAHRALTAARKPATEQTQSHEKSKEVNITQPEPKAPIRFDPCPSVAEGLAFSQPKIAVVTDSRGGR